jgi:vacuolar-type H+-ATPase subunit I/STV1
MPEEELKQFNALERALDTLATAPAEDREIRLKEVEQIEVGTKRLKELKEICVGSYRSFIEAVRLLDEARAQTLKTESAVAEARSDKQDGGAVSESQRARLKEMSEKAASSLSAVNQSLDRAEKLVDSCEKARTAQRTLASSSR